MSYLGTWYNSAKKPIGNLHGDKSLAKDKVKSDALKKIDDVYKRMKALLDEQDKLKPRILSANNLQGDIKDFYKKVETFMKDADSLAKEVKKISPDTAKKDFFYVAAQFGDLKPDEVKKEISFTPQK